MKIPKRYCRCCGKFLNANDNEIDLCIICYLNLDAYNEVLSDIIGGESPYRFI